MMNPYRSNSREHQDFFILSVLDKKQNGTHVEIGSGPPIHSSNTYLLETSFWWRGVGIEWGEWYVQEHQKSRRNPCLRIDATTANYSEIFEKYNLGPHIDFLQLDIDPPDNTFKALNCIDFNKYSFSVITYEHDFYNGGASERTESRTILESYGYTRVITDVQSDDLVFEDWYVNEKYMPNDNWKEFIGSNIKLNPGNTDPRYVELFNKFLSI